MKWQKALLTIPGFNAPPIPLLHGEGGAQVSLGTPDWAVIRMPVVFTDIESLIPGTMPAAGATVQDVAYSTGQTEELFFDSLCECINPPVDAADPEPEEICFRNDDCCNSAKEGGTFICWSDPSTPVPAGGEKVKTCSDCRETYEYCNTPKDCCGGEENSLCNMDPVPTGEYLPCTPGPNDDFCIPQEVMEVPDFPVCRPKPTDPGDVH
jgi:hypothetical protein